MYEKKISNLKQGSRSPDEDGDKIFLNVKSKRHEMEMTGSWQNFCSSNSSKCDKQRQDFAVLLEGG